MLENFKSLNKFYSRPFASNGLWVFLLLPLSILISSIKNQVALTPTYKLAGCISVNLLCNALTFYRQYKKDDKWKFLDITTLSTSVIFGFVFNNYVLNDLCSVSAWMKSLIYGFFITFVYIKTYCWLMRNIKYSFTFGEAGLVTQSFVIFLNCFAYSLHRILTYGAETVLKSNMQISTLIIQTGLVGILLLAFTVYSFNIKSTTAFYLITFLILTFAIILPLHAILSINPIIWIFDFILSNTSLLKLFIYWFICVFLTALVVRSQINRAQKASTATRKIFHILAVSVYVPGLYYQCTFLYLASGVSLGIFLMLEILRIQSIPPLGQHLQDGFVVLKDEKDSGLLALSPIYLLVGLSLPLWIHPSPCDITDSAELTMLPLLSGILSIGIGDSAASCIGSKLGRYKWRNTNKTIEGTLANIVSQLVFISVLSLIGFLSTLSDPRKLIVILSSLFISIIEAETSQIDNIVLPLILYVIFI